MKEYGTTTTGGRYAEYPQTTDFDLDRPFKDILAEIAECCEWSVSKARDAMDFGVRNTRQGEFARKNETSAKKCLQRLKDLVVSLAIADRGAEAKEMSVFLRDNAGNDEIIVAKCQELWPSDETPEDWEKSIGAEEEQELVE